MVSPALTPQVDASHYEFGKYVTRKRWDSFWHQIDEVTRLVPKTVLEVGPGLGVLKSVLATLGIDVRTVDIDPALSPDILGSALNLPIADNSVDVACAFQVLEHFPFDDSGRAFAELARVANKGIVISLPDSRRKWPYSIYIPKVGQKDFILTPPHAPKAHEFNGQHYWELNAKGYDENDIIRKFETYGNCTLLKRYSAPRNPYHRFMIFQKA